jgi:hypothetical protein
MQVFVGMGWNYVPVTRLVLYTLVELVFVAIGVGYLDFVDPVIRQGQEFILVGKLLPLPTEWSQSHPRSFSSKITGRAIACPLNTLQIHRLFQNGQMSHVHYTMSE